MNINNGDFIRIRCLLHGYFTLKMASIIGVSTSTIWCLENKKKMPSLRNCMILSRYFGVSIDEMVGYKTTVQYDVLDKLQIICDDWSIDMDRIEVINTVVDAVLLHRNGGVIG